MGKGEKDGLLRGTGSVGKEQEVWERERKIESKEEQEVWEMGGRWMVKRNRKCGKWEKDEW